MRANRTANRDIALGGGRFVTIIEELDHRPGLEIVSVITLSFIGRIKNTRERSRFRPIYTADS